MGYVGLGFSPNGGMRGADIVLGWVDAAGKVILHVSQHLFFLRHSVSQAVFTTVRFLEIVMLFIKS